MNSVQLHSWRPSVLADALASLILDVDPGLDSGGSGQAGSAALRRRQLGQQARAYATRYLSSLALSARVPYVFNATQWHSTKAV